MAAVNRLNARPTELPPNPVVRSEFTDMRRRRNRGYAFRPAHRAGIDYSGRDLVYAATHVGTYSECLRGPPAALARRERRTRGNIVHNAGGCEKGPGLRRAVPERGSTARRSGRKALAGVVAGCRATECNPKDLDDYPVKVAQNLGLTEAQRFKAEAA